MKEIKLTMGQVAIIDDDDFEKVSQYKWFARKAKNTYYAATWVGDWRDRKMLHLHHLIAGLPSEGMFVDHEDRDGLNNQKRNLRHCTIQQNSANRTSYGTSKYLGVSIVKARGRTYWRAFVGFNGKSIYLGFFKKEEDAALAYNEAAKKYHGEFANLNGIPNDIPVLPHIVVANYDNDAKAIIIQKQ